MLFLCSLIYLYLHFRCRLIYIHRVFLPTLSNIIGVYQNNSHVVNNIQCRFKWTKPVDIFVQKKTVIMSI